MIKTRPFNWDEYDPKIHEVRTRCGHKVTELRLMLAVDTCDKKQALTGFINYCGLKRMEFWNINGIYHSIIDGSNHARDLVFREEVYHYAEIEKISKQNKEENEGFLMYNYVFIFIVIAAFLFLLF